MLFLLGKDRKTEHNTHFCMPLEPVFTRDCGSGVHFTDEPTASLDHENAFNVMKILKKYAEERLVIVVTHDRSILSDVDILVEMWDGKLSNVVQWEAER